LRLRRTHSNSFNTLATAPALRAKKSAPSGKWRKYFNSSIIFRAISIILVFVIAFCSYSLADKEINGRITVEKYNKINGGVGNVDNPTKTDYSSVTAPWISLLDTLDPNGYDPLSLPPLGVVSLERPDSTLSPTSLETALGYVNRQQQIWELHDINPDIAAWIYIPGLGINYPVAIDTKEDDFYLTHAYDRSFSYSGTIFMNPATNINPLAQNLIFHGHNMKNDSMFGNLQNYIKGTKEFYDSHRFIFVDTLYGSYRYEIFSTYVTDKEDIYLKTGFPDTSSFIDFCQTLKAKGKYSTDIPFYANDRILTLSTCNAADNSKRVIVEARLAYPDPNQVVQTTSSPSTSTPTPTPSPAPTAMPTSDKYVIKPTDVNGAVRLRKEPNTKSTTPVLANLYYGFEVTLLEDDGDWIKIQTQGGMQGYIMKQYAVKESDFTWTVPTAAPTPLPSPTPAP